MMSMNLTVRITGSASIWFFVHTGKIGGFCTQIFTFAEGLAVTEPQPGFTAFHADLALRILVSRF
jgi:hypothetical protein